MATIQIPDDQAAALQAKANAQGLTLEAWLRALAGMEEPRRARGKYKLADLVAKCDPTARLSDDDTEWLQAPAVGREAL